MSGCEQCGNPRAEWSYRDERRLCFRCYADRPEPGDDVVVGLLDEPAVAIATSNGAHPSTNGAAPAAPERPAGMLEVVEADGRTPRAVHWAWDLRLPLHALSVLAGLPDAGKSTTTCRIAADITNGALPGELHGTPRKVLMVSLEDTIDRVLIPRLILAGANLRHVAFVRARAEHGGVVDLTRHLVEIETEATERRPALIVIDPLVAALGTGKLDSHKDQHVRTVLAPAALMAERLDLAVLGVMHFGKGAMDALLGVGGSIGFVGAARSVLALLTDPDDGHLSSRRILGHVKSNWGPKQKSREVTIVSDVVEGYGDPISSSYVRLGGEVDVDPNDLVAVRANGRPPSERETVKRAIPALIGVAGPLMRAKIAIALGRTPKDGTVRRALDELVAEGTLGQAGENPAIYSLREGVPEGGCQKSRWSSGTPSGTPSDTHEEEDE